MITGRVLDSVQQINARCSELTSVAREVPMLDVATAAQYLEVAVKRLNEVFDNSPEDTYRIKECKNNVDAQAVLLEKLICIRTGKYADIIKLRNFAKTLYKDYNLRIREMAEVPNVPNQVVFEWSSYATFILRLSVCSTQTCFELDAEDEEMIEKITKAMSAVNNFVQE